MKEARELAKEVREEIRQEEELFTKGVIKKAIVDAALAWEKYCKLQQRRDELVIKTVDQICKEEHFTHYME